jgi:hypothetical protein
MNTDATQQNVSVAQQSPDPSDKTILLDIAQKWRELAHQLEAEESDGGNR